MTITWSCQSTAHTTVYAEFELVYLPLTGLSSTAHLYTLARLARGDGADRVQARPSSMTRAMAPGVL